MILDGFTRQRLLKFADAHREKTAQLPTLKDFEAVGFDKWFVEKLVKEGDLVELYVTMTSGAVVKAYKRKD